MRNKTGVIALGIIGTIILTFTITAFFLLKIERTVLNVLALVFLLMSELVLFCGLISFRFINNNHNTVFLRAGISSTLLLYFLTTLVSILFAGAFKDNISFFILIELAIIALFSISAISIFALSGSISRRNQTDITKVDTTEPKRGGL